MILFFSNCNCNLIRVQFHVSPYLRWLRNNVAFAQTPLLIAISLWVLLFFIYMLVKLLVTDKDFTDQVNNFKKRKNKKNQFGSVLMSIFYWICRHTTISFVFDIFSNVCSSGYNYFNQGSYNDGYQQGSYNQQGYYGNSHSGHNNQQGGYNNQQSGYKNQQSGYNNQNPAPSAPSYNQTPPYNSHGFQNTMSDNSFSNNAWYDILNTF